MDSIVQEAADPATIDPWTVMLPAVDKAVGIVRTAPDPLVGIQQGLAIVGEAGDLDRISLFELEVPDGTERASHRIEWRAGESDLLIDDPERQNVPVDERFGVWQQIFNRASEVNLTVGDLPREDREFLRGFGIESVASVPGYSEGRFTGVLTLVDAHEERRWSSQEMALFRIVASAVAGAFSRHRVVNELEEQHRRFQLAVETAFTGLTIVTPDRSWVQANPAFCEMVGYTEEELQELPPGKLVHPDDYLNDDDRVKQLLDGELDSYEIEKRYLHKDGSTIWVRRRVALVRDALEEPQYFIVHSSDITEPKQARLAAQEHRELFQTVFEEAAIGMALVSPDGRWLQVNRALCKILGYSEIELTSTDFQSITHPDDLEADLVNVRRLLDGEKTSYRMEKRYLGNDSEVIWGLLNVSLVRDESDNPLYFISQIQDITELKEAEQRLAERIRELDRSNADLEQFAYVASHDLQEPLRMIAGYTQLLARRYKGQLDEDADDFIEYALDGTVRMQALINDLLSYSRVGTRGKNPVDADVDDALDLALSNLTYAIEESDARITRDPLPSLAADHSQISQLFQNLIGNAIKFRSDNPPRVHISARQEEGHWVFSVADNGIGFDPRYAERIFGIFESLHPRDKFSGTGIGLAVCKKIVERHGGHIRAESVEGEGTTVFFTMPEKVEFVS